MGGTGHSFVRTVVSLTRPEKRLILLLIDLVFVPVSLAAAHAIQYSTTTPLNGVLLTWPLIPLLMIAAVALSLSLGSPNVSLKDYDITAAARTFVIAMALAVTSAALAALGSVRVPPGFHVIFGLVYFAGSAVSRIVLLHALLAIYRRSDAITRVLIYGAGRTGMSLATALKHRPDIIPVAFLDDSATLRGLLVAGLPVFPGVHAERVMKKYKIDRVILAMPSLSIQKQSFLSRRMEALGLEVQTLPAFAQLIGEESLVDKLLPTRAGALLSRAQLSDEMVGGCAEYHNTNVMITGAGGSIGLELCRQVLGCGPRRLVLFELSELALYNAEMELKVLAEGSATEIVPVLGSITDAALVGTTIRQHEIDAVLHAAAYKHVPLVESNARAGIGNNSLGTAVLAQQARDAGVRRFVLVSSDKAVRPANVMGASKRLAEIVVQDLATRSDRTIFSIVRFGNVLGSSGSVIPLFQEQIARGGPVTLTDEGVTRYFMTIHEAARLVLLAGSFAEGGEVFVLDMGEPVYIRDLARQLIEVSGYTVRDAANPQGDIEIVTTGLRPGEKLREELWIRKGAQTTSHPKIISVREDHLSELEVAAALKGLKEAVCTDDDSAVRMMLTRWIPEFRADDRALAKVSGGNLDRA